MAEPRRVPDVRRRATSCGSGTRCCATPRTRSSRSGAGASCTPAPAKRSRPRLDDHPETEAELLSLHFFHAQRFDGRRGASPASPGSGPGTSTRTSKPPSSSSARSRRPGAVPTSRPTTSRRCGRRSATSASAPACSTRRSPPTARPGRCRAGDPVGEAELLLKEAWIAETDGRLSNAVRHRPARATGGSTTRRPDEVAGVRASLTAFYAAVRAGQGRFDEAVPACLEAIDEADQRPGTWRRRRTRASSSTGPTCCSAGPSSRCTPLARSRSTRSSATSTARPQVLNNLGRVRLLRGPLGRRGRALRAGSRDPAAHRQRGGSRVHRLQHRRGAHRPGPPRGGRGAASATRSVSPRGGQEALRRRDRAPAPGPGRDARRRPGARASSSSIEARAPVRERCRTRTTSQEVDVLLAECHLVAGEPAPGARDRRRRSRAANPTRLADARADAGSRAAGARRRRRGPRARSKRAWPRPASRTRSTRSRVRSTRSSSSTCSAGDLATAEPRELESTELFTPPGHPGDAGERSSTSELRIARPKRDLERDVAVPVERERGPAAWSPATRRGPWPFGPGRARGQGRAPGRRSTVDVAPREDDQRLQDRAVREPAGGAAPTGAPRRDEPVLRELPRRGPHRGGPPGCVPGRGPAERGAPHRLRHGRGQPLGRRAAAGADERCRPDRGRTCATPTCPAPTCTAPTSGARSSARRSCPTSASTTRTAERRATQKARCSVACAGCPIGASPGSGMRSPRSRPTARRSSAGRPGAPSASSSSGPPGSRRGFWGQGVRPGDKVAIDLTNRPEYLETFYAARQARRRAGERQLPLRRRGDPVPARRQRREGRRDRGRVREGHPQGGEAARSDAGTAGSSTPASSRSATSYEAAIRDRRGDDGWRARPRAATT